MARCITCSWEARPKASSNTAGARCYSCQLPELSSADAGRKNLRRHHEMNEKRGDEFSKCTASAIRRLGGSGCNRNRHGGLLSTLSFGLARNHGCRRDLRGHSLALAKLDRDLHNCRSLLLQDRKSTRLNSSHVAISYAVFCLKKKK